MILMQLGNLRVLLFCVGLLLGLTAHSRADVTFKYRVDKPGVTSAGVYDLQGHLVQSPLDHEADDGRRA